MTKTLNALTDELLTKINGVEDGAEINPTASETKTAYESNADTNAYTDAEKSKLGNIAPGAEVNVQSDWTQTDTGADDYIKNKPGSSAIGFAGAYHIPQIERYCDLADTYYKVPLEFTVVSATNFTFNSTDDRWEYTGTETGYITIVCTFTGYHDDGSVREISWEFRKNGLAASVPAAPKVTDIEASDSMSVTMVVPALEMSTNDYIELWVAIDSASDKAYMSNMNFLIR